MQSKIGKICFFHLKGFFLLLLVTSRSRFLRSAGLVAGAGATAADAEVGGEEVGR